MNYSKFQRFLSFLLIFIMLSGMTFQIPFFQFASYAIGVSDSNIVSIIVEENAYKKLRSKIERYASDISTKIHNADVRIYPTPKNVKPFQIASLNESLYYGDGSDGSVGGLVGTIIMGDLHLPVVYDNSTSSKTIVPYVDFDEKAYIYNHETGKYEKNEKNISGFKPEIWHGVMTPNLGSDTENIQGLSDYLDKNHDFYAGSGVFGGKRKQPNVFYYDAFRESQTLSYNSYKGYESYMNHKEDIVYNRFTKELAEQILEEVLGEDDEKPEIENTPDVQTRHIINKTTNNFLEIFSKGFIGGMRKNVHNAGRYNVGSNGVNVDFAPYFVTVLDTVNDEILKSANEQLEKQIDSIIIDGGGPGTGKPLQKDIEIPYHYKEETSIFNCDDEYENFYYGKKGKTIKSVADCSIFRGSNFGTGSKLVEANRGLNMKNVESDMELLKEENIYYRKDDKLETSTACLDGLVEEVEVDGEIVKKLLDPPLSLNGYWGNNSPLYLDTGTGATGSGIIQLKEERDLKSAIFPLFDITGSKRAEIGRNAPSYKDCIGENINFIQTKNSTVITPLEGTPWCKVEKQLPTEYTGTGTRTDIGERCLIPNSGTSSYDKELTQTGSISSVMKHVSPTPTEIGAEIRSGITQDLPVDVDRYVDFQDQGGNYTKINYPYLFRYGVKEDEELNFENLDKNLELTLKEWNGQLDGYDLYLDFLKKKPSDTVSVDDDAKKVDYYDTLIFAMYWNNLNSVSAKYKFIFENYLSDQFGGNEFMFNLPKNKKEYEIAYLGSHGDAQNMYIKLDPEGKGENPFTSIITQNVNLSSSLMGLNISDTPTDGAEEEAVFKCAPPEGVPITEWIPAITCWLGDMLPATISLSEGACGVSLLSIEEREQYETCSGDVNKNGVNDCIESKLEGGQLILTSSADKYYYGKSGKLHTEIQDAGGSVVTLDSVSNVDFKITKVEKITERGNPIIVYEEGGDKKALEPYVDFKDLSMRANAGKAKYGFVSKQKDTNIYFQTSLIVKDKLGGEVVFLESEEIKVEVRGDRLFGTSYLLENTEDGIDVGSGKGSLHVGSGNNLYLFDTKKNSIEGIQNIIGSDSLSDEKLLIGLENISKAGNMLDINYPITVNLEKDDEKLIDNKILTEVEVESFAGLYSFTKSGNYHLEITDADQFSIQKELEILPGVASNLEISIGSNIIQNEGVVTTNLISLLDRFGNPVAGDIYGLNLSLDGDGMLFEENAESRIETQIVEGYKAFKTVTTAEVGFNTLTVNILDIDGKVLLLKEKEIEVIDDVNIVVKPLSTDIKVGGERYKYEVSVRDEKGRIIDGFSSRIYFGMNKIYGKSTQAYFDLINGVGVVEFQSSTVAGRDIQVEYQIEGLKGITRKFITIFPELPIKMDLSLSKSKMKASEEEFSLLKVELKDGYGNIAFNDTETTVGLEIEQKHEIIQLKETKKLANGIFTFKLYGTEEPGIAFFKAMAPKLASNTFVASRDGSEITVQGVGEAAGKIETFFFLNKDTIDNTKYNALYTTLLGAPYGDITQEDYLAGSMLFNRNNRSLAITSLLNDPYLYTDVLKIEGEGGVDFVYNGSDITQDIESSLSIIDGKVQVEFFNEALNIYMGKTVYNVGNKFQTSTCLAGVENCDLEKNETTYLLSNTSELYNIEEKSNGTLMLQNIFGNALFTLDPEGKISFDSSVELKVNKNDGNTYLLIDILKNQEKIGEFGIRYVDGQLSVSRDESLFTNKIKNLSNSILILLRSNSYGTREFNNEGILGRTIHYNDPFAATDALNNFSKSSLYGYENFVKKGGLGWEGENKTLLNFTSGMSVGESVKKYQTFSVVNLGDPVLSLKGASGGGLGKMVSNDKEVHSYRIFDYNGDGNKDLLLIKNDNYLQLLENIGGGNFKDRGNIAHIFDMGDKALIKTGDFLNGDDHDDIAFVNTDGELFVLVNDTRIFKRYKASSLSTVANSMSTLGSIIRMEKFDMDNDGFEDLVVMDDAGAIKILYADFYIFGDVLIDNIVTVTESNGIELSEELRNDKGFLYFTGLNEMATGGDGLDGVNEDIVYNLVFTDIDYHHGETPGEEEILETDFSGEETVQDFIDGQGGYKNSYIRSEYSEYAGLKVEKKFTDANGGFLSSGDTVQATITIKNESAQKKEDITYLEDSSSTLDLIRIPDTAPLKLSKNADIDYFVPGYTFAINNLTLQPGESIQIHYELKTKKLSYGYLKLGMFGKHFPWYDQYGDIIVKKDNKNCSGPNNIYKSVGVRSYGGLSSAFPICDPDAIGLPPEVSDGDGNSIPDYLDDLIAGGADGIIDFSQEKLDEMYQDSDGDGMPDMEDPFQYEGNMMRDVGGIGANVDSALENIDTLIQGFSCGFGGGGCVATPLNWAPLAPGGDPTLFGYPIGDGLMVGEGMPIFSAMTWAPYGPICGPAVWPPSPLMEGCATTGAGGYLGTLSPSNTFRLFVSPTLTGGLGTAACFGGPAATAGYSNMPGVSPLFPGGNCIVTAQPMSSCSGNGSEGFVDRIGFAETEIGGAEYINANCSEGERPSRDLDTDAVSAYMNYKKTGVKPGNLESDLQGALTDLARPNSSNHPGINEPLFSFNGEGMGADISLGIDFGGGDEGSFPDIEIINQTRISPFPSFLMDWVTRQVEEIVTKLTDFPTLFVILPSFSGIGGEEKIEIENKGLKDKAQVSSGIKEVYTFLSNTPLVNIEQETLNVSIPWVDEETMRRTLKSWGGTKDQWEQEIQEAKEKWSFGAACEGTAEEMSECEERNAAGEKLILNAEGLVHSLDRNMEVLNEYKEIPEKLHELVNKKQDYMEQILCNVDSISEIMSGWITRNGKRFQAWVELYVLIKAILKSWQVLIDVFVDYEAECQECKNERGDLLEFEFSLIDMVIPQIPVIQFPKWPDIYMDLHNIRAGLDIYLPEFNFSTRPIVLPNLPRLILPDVPTLGIVIPELPILPSFDIPELPDLPTLPTIELPNLPPPPTLPKMFASLEGVLDILKLITKAMCILKTSPFVPEWRAGDQISFLTERSGFLSLDFLNISLPQFSVPAVDAIKVTSYVNLEFETDFILELARQATQPLNAFGSDVSSQIDLHISDLDFSVAPTTIDVKVGGDGDTSIETGYDPIKLFAVVIFNKLMGVSHNLEANKDVTVSNLEFRQLINDSLASKSFAGNQKLDEIRKVWDTVDAMTYSKEEKLIQKLQKNNREKFQVVSDILNTEIQKTKILKKRITELTRPSYITNVASYNQSNIELYKDQLAPYSEAALESYNVLKNGGENDEKISLQKAGKELLAQMDTPLSKYKKSGNDLLAKVEPRPFKKIETPKFWTYEECEEQSNAEYQYDFKGIYRTNGSGDGSLLFDYLDELDGNEKIEDFEGGVLYMMNGQIYMKGPFSPSYGAKAPTTISKNNNSFYNGDVFYESVNNFQERTISNTAISMEFLAPQSEENFNYRVETLRVINRDHQPDKMQQEIIDAFAGIDIITKFKENEIYKIRKNLGYIQNLGSLNTLKLKSKRIENIKDNLSEGKAINISIGTRLYAGGESFRLTYISEGSDEVKGLVVGKYQNIEFKEQIKILGLSGNAYLEGAGYEYFYGEEMRSYIGKPLFPGTIIDLWDAGSEGSTGPAYVDIEYYDDSEANLHFVNSLSGLLYRYEIYDVGPINTNYVINISRDSGVYYYAKMSPFLNNVMGSSSPSVLLAPQKESDQIAPDLSLNSVRIPVYQQRTIDITDYVFEDQGFNNIAGGSVSLGEVYDEQYSVEVFLSKTQLKLIFPVFHELIKKDIDIFLTDKNENTEKHTIPFEVYAPIPEINSFIGSIIEGKIDEDLSNEPINLYRYRGGVITKIESSLGDLEARTEIGSYTFPVDESEGGLELKSGDTLLATIHERTGKIDVSDFSLNLEVLSSNNTLNESAYPKIIINKLGKELYYEYLKLSGNSPVQLIDEFNETLEKGMYMKFIDKTHYNYYSIPDTAKYNKGAMVIYRNTSSKKEPLFTVFSDGRVNTLNENYSLEYDTVGDYVVFQMKDKHFNRIIGEILFKVDGAYVMQ